MKKLSVKLTIPEIIDCICELEGYIEHLEDRLKETRAAYLFTRKQDSTNLTKAKNSLVKYKALLNVKSMEV